MLNHFFWKGESRLSPRVLLFWDLLDLRRDMSSRLGKPFSLYGAGSFEGSLAASSGAALMTSSEVVLVASSETALVASSGAAQVASSEAKPKTSSEAAALTAETYSVNGAAKITDLWEVLVGMSATTLPNDEGLITSSFDEPPRG